jgi:hypothetical protein
VYTILRHHCNIYSISNLVFVAQTGQLWYHSARTASESAVDLLGPISQHSTSRLRTDPRLDYTIEQMYDGCGISKGCFGCSTGITNCSIAGEADGCIANKNCGSLVNYHLTENDQVEFQLLFHGGQEINVSDGTWIGVGLSTDNIMVKLITVILESSNNRKLYNCCWSSSGRRQCRCLQSPDRWNYF